MVKVVYREFCVTNGSQFEGGGVNDGGIYRFSFFGNTTSRRIFGLKLKKFTMPNVFPGTVFGDYNKFIFIKDPTGVATTKEFILPDGNYTTKQFSDTVEALINTFFIGAGFNMVYDSISGKWLFSSSFGFDIIIPDISTLRICFGMGRGDNISSLLGYGVLIFSGGIYTFTSPYPVILAVVNSLFLRCDITNKLHHENIIPTMPSDNRNILCVIPINASPGGFILYQDESNEGYFSCLPNTTITDFELYLTRENEDIPLLFNNATFTAILGLLTEESQVSN